MTHPDEDRLIDLALDPAAIDPAVRDHVTECAKCRADVQAYRDTAQILRDEPPIPTDGPPAGTWAGIAATIGRDETSARQVRDRPRTASRWWFAAAGVAAGLVLGVVTGWAAARDDTSPPDPVATPTAQPDTALLADATLTPPDGGDVGGHATLARTGGLDHLDLEMLDKATPRAGEVYEVWLLHRDGTRMVSLGVMPDLPHATFPVPATLRNEGYEIVDVSVEPLDQDPTHSGNSLLRGNLGT